MNALVNQEKARLQALFGPLNRGGSWITLAEDFLTCRQAALSPYRGWHERQKALT